MQAEAFSTAKVLEKVLKEEGQCESGECQSIKKIYKAIWEYCWNNMIDHEHGAWFRIRYFYIYVIIGFNNLSAIWLRDVFSTLTFNFI